MEVYLKETRLAFGNGIWKPQVVKDSDSEPSYSCQFLIDPEKQPKLVKTIRAAMNQVAKEKWGAKAAVIMKKLEKMDKLCLHDGDTKEELDGYEGMLFVSARSKVKPTIVDRNREDLTIRDGRPYSGCIVTGLVDIYPQDNSFGKRINASLMGVQFVRDGEPFGGGRRAKADDFEDLGIDDDDDMEDDDDDDSMV